jgi:hypothetical protein
MAERRRSSRKGRMGGMAERRRKGGKAEKGGMAERHRKAGKAEKRVGLLRGVLGRVGRLRSGWDC